MKQAPCKGCERRKPGCHSVCEDYLEFASYREKARRNRAEYQDLRDYDRVTYNKKTRKLRNRFGGKLYEV